MRTFTAILEKEEDMYVARCPEVGTVSQGHTIEEALVNLKEATELYLEEFPLKETKHPLHKELKIGTLKGILQLAKINEEDFAKYQ